MTIALVTGGLGGIGTAICRRFCSDGYTVVTTYTHNGKRLETWLNQQKTAGYEGFHPYQCDITNWDECVALKQQMESDGVGAVGYFGQQRRYYPRCALCQNDAADVG